jgi:signal transduction histidine kinase
VVEQGRAVRLTGAFRDVTAQKTHERALEEARLEAEKANVAKSQFLANMSHEIRTPMNGVTGMLALLLHSDLGERQRQQAQTAYDSAAGLMRVLNDILDYSKLEANALQLEQIEYQPRQVIDEVIGMLAPQAAEKGIALTSSLDPAVPASLVGDPVRLRQILVNLAGNAVKFTETGSVRIGGRLEGREPGWVRFTVTDTGPGIPAEVQGRLFTRFAQADETIMRRHGGTGLGLAISKQLVEAFGGQIGVISRPDEGSRFWFTIPAERPKSNVRPIQLRSVATTRHAG